MHLVEKILNNTTPYGKIRASHEGSLHSSTLNRLKMIIHYSYMMIKLQLGNAIFKAQLFILVSA